MLIIITPPVLRRIRQELANSKLDLTSLINQLLTEALDDRERKAAYRADVEQRYGR
jgi:uncharacterized phage protein gp47/JayE